jgi:hypothetical protein
MLQEKITALKTCVKPQQPSSRQTAGHLPCIYGRKQTAAEAQEALKHAHNKASVVWEVAHTSHQGAGVIPHTHVSCNTANTAVFVGAAACSLQRLEEDAGRRSLWP